MVETLLMRNESKGSSYPIILEKLVFLLSIIGFVFLNQYAWSNLDSTLYQWLSSIGLVLCMLILNELFGRTIQSIRTRA